jgi:hypothetical protein
MDGASTLTTLTPSPRSTPAIQTIAPVPLRP